MSNFYLKIDELRNGALDHIKSCIIKGSSRDLTDPSNHENELTDAVYDLPRGSYVNKYSEHDEYAIVAVRHSMDGWLSFHGIGLGEANGEEYDFNPGELTTETVCQIADLVNYE